MYQASVWLRYGVNVTGSSAMSAYPPARASPAAAGEFNISSWVSRPAATRSSRIVGAADAAQGSLWSTARCSVNGTPKAEW